MLGLLQVRATVAEIFRWKRRAAGFGITLSELVRATMNKTKVRVIAVADPAVLHELQRHGNNFNQLMHAINAGYPVDPRRVLAVIATMQAFYLREIERG